MCRGYWILNFDTVNFMLILKAVYKIHKSPKVKEVWSSLYVGVTTEHGWRQCVMRDSRHHGPSFPWSSTHPHHWDPPHHLLHKHHIRQEQINYLLSYLTTQANSQSKNRKQHTAMTKTSHGRQCVDFRGNRQIDAVIHICTVAKANDQSTHLHTHTHTHTYTHL